MNTPLLSIVIPTIGRDSLPDTLVSIRNQAPSSEIEIIVVEDTFNTTRSFSVGALCDDYDAWYMRYNAGYHEEGHPQTQYGYEQAHGQYLWNLGDDDVMIPDIWSALRKRLDGVPAVWPVMVQARLYPSPRRGDQAVPVVLWSDVGDVRRGRITGQNLICPNVKGKIGLWGDDFEHISRTLALYNNEAVWSPIVVAECF